VLVGGTGAELGDIGATVGDTGARVGVIGVSVGDKGARVGVIGELEGAIGRFVDRIGAAVGEIGAFVGGRVGITLGIWVIVVGEEAGVTDVMAVAATQFPPLQHKSLDPLGVQVYPFAQ
jgi:hypothetical protein